MSLVRFFMVGTRRVEYAIEGNFRVESTLVEITRPRVLCTFYERKTVMAKSIRPLHATLWFDRTTHVVRVTHVDCDVWEPAHEVTFGDFACDQDLPPLTIDSLADLVRLFDAHAFLVV